MYTYVLMQSCILRNKNSKKLLENFILKFCFLHPQRSVRNSFQNSLSSHTYFNFQKNLGNSSENHTSQSQKRVFDSNYWFFRENSEYMNTVVAAVEKKFSSNRSIMDICKVDFSKNLMIQDVNQTQLDKPYIQALSTLHLKDAMTLLANNQSDISSKMLQWLEEECALRADNLPLDLGLYLLDAWFLVSAENTFKGKYFKALLKTWEAKINEFSKNNIVQAVYILGLAKDAPLHLVNNIQARLELISDQISAEEWAIICSGFFKIRKKINSDKLLHRICEATGQNLFHLSRFHLINILKALRHAQYFDSQMWHLLEEYIIHNYLSFNFVECTHFLATFANFQFYNKDVFTCLEVHGLCLLQNEKLKKAGHEVGKFRLHPSLQSRAKDVTRFLWAIAHMKHIPDSAFFLETIVNVLHEKWDEYSLIRNIHYLIDCFQSFILMDYYPLEFFDKILNPGLIGQLSVLKRDKPFHQLYFICNSLKIECKNSHILYNKLIKYGKPMNKSIYDNVMKRSGFQDLLYILKLCFDVSQFKCCYKLPHIAIAGVVIQTKALANLEEMTGDQTHPLPFNSENTLLAQKNVFSNCTSDTSDSEICVEILDPTVCIHSTRTLLGLMDVKLRQLKKLNYKVVTITPEEISTLLPLSAEELKLKIGSYLKFK